MFDLAKRLEQDIQEAVSRTAEEFRTRCPECRTEYTDPSLECCPRCWDDPGEDVGLVRLTYCPRCGRNYTRPQTEGICPSCRADGEGDYTVTTEKPLTSLKGRLSERSSHLEEQREARGEAIGAVLFGLSLDYSMGVE